MAYIFITNNDTDVKDMLDNKKASAYLPYTGPKVENILKNELIFIYRTESGVIAYGYSSGQNIIDSKCNSGLNSTLEDYVVLDKFTSLKMPVPFSVLRKLYSKYHNNKLVFVNITTKTISEMFASSILNEIEK